MKAGPVKPEFCLMAGDFTEHGTVPEFTAMRDLFNGLGLPYRGVIGNHDYQKQTDRAPYEEIFPDRINHWFEHRAWQTVGLAPTDSLRSSRTQFQDPNYK